MNTDVRSQAEALGLPLREESRDRLQIREIPPQGLVLRIRRDPSAIAGDLGLSTAVEAWFLLFRMGVEVSVRFEGTCGLRVCCSRCLEGVDLSLTFGSRVTFLPIAAEVDPERELMADDLGVAFYRNPEIPLLEMVREEILLLVPMQPLCTPLCQGLCSKCGRRLGRAACECRDADIDPRWKDLQSLLESGTLSPRSS